ncbi:hypothetical protein J3R83DRAFT_3600 [Lanmaoa asiatica]|nr:hypothetical protein J3R83DRAFT_3600 [Lanmaoa asiatica]
MNNHNDSGSAIDKDSEYRACILNLPGFCLSNLADSITVFFFFMQDSDDNYFSDDLVLDDKTLAVLDEEESKFKRITSTQPQQSVGPPAKRQKTTRSWQPQSVSRTIRRADTSLEDMEDLPDISIRQDGTYGLQDKQRRVSGPLSRSGIVPGPNVVVQAGSGSRPTTAPLSRGSVPLMRSTSGTGSVRAIQVPSRPPSSARGTRIAQSPVSSQEVSRTQSGPPQRVNRVPSTTVSGNYVEQLLQQIEELRKKNEAIHADMESALEAKFAKDGEVTILRKRLEKTAQEHLAQLAKIKSAKDEADAKHVQLQKQYEADKERLKTELTFRRHELETSSRKHSVPLIPKNDVSQTAEPSQKQRSGQWSSAGPSRLAPETPRRPRFGVISDFEKPKKTTALETRDLPSGFQTGPPCSQFAVGRKGKETTSFSASHASTVTPNASPVPQGSNSRVVEPELFGTQMDDGGPVEDFVPHVDVGIDDVHMVDEGTPVMTLSSQEHTAVLALPSWNLVLHDIMLTHTLQGSKLPTLQLLVCASPADTGQVQSYGAALIRIFDTLGGIPAHPDRDFDRLARITCCALCEITELLAKNNLISPLTAVLNLLTNLAYMLPSIHALLLSQCVSNHDETPQLLGVLHNIIQDQLQDLDVTTGNESLELCSLGKETLSLYEALVWWIPDDLEDSLNACSSMRSLLTTLLHPHRPLWFLNESIRVLLWLSTRRNLFRSLLSHPASKQTGNNGELVDLVHHPQIGLACSLLTDTDRSGPEADELKSRIIMFFGMLSNAHPDAYTLLVESEELIPSIVLYLSHLVAPIWDENGVVFNDPRAATRTIHIINHTTLLLHHLVIGEDATLDLRERLLRAPAKTYQGLIHFFILTFGRLSYANPPYWLNGKDRRRLVGVAGLCSAIHRLISLTVGVRAELARALLERVIQGPELDLIWETYQDEGDENNEAAMDVDDEEVEAQKIANS